MKTTGAGLIFPSLLILMQLGAAAVYGWQHDWRRLAYWLAASALVAAVTY